MIRKSDEDDISNSSIIYNIEQDSVNFSPALQQSINNILVHNDVTGMLVPSLAALKSVHAITKELTAEGQTLVLSNIRHLEMVKKQINQLPSLSDEAVQTLVAAELNPMDVEVINECKLASFSQHSFAKTKMVALGNAIENLVGLLQICEENENLKVISHMSDLSKQLDCIKSRTEIWRNNRNTIINIM